MVYLSQVFQNSQRKFQLGISRFKILSNSLLASVKTTFTTTGHSYFLFLTACKSRRRSWAIFLTTILRSRRNGPSSILSTSLTLSTTPSGSVYLINFCSLISHSFMSWIIILTIRCMLLMSRLWNSKRSWWLDLSLRLWLGNLKSLSLVLVTNLTMLSLQVMTSFSTLSLLILHSSARMVTNSGRALRRRQCRYSSF